MAQSEVDRANQTADTLLTAVGMREQAPARVADATETRLLAYNLLLRDYGEVRRAVSFLRWHQGDADTLAPSLFAGRGPRKRGEDPRPAVLPASTSGESAPAPSSPLTLVKGS